MPAGTPTINLLIKEDLEHSPWGRLLTWSTTYGRYIMITTEIVVLLAFISRFSLDRKLTDLKEEIKQKQAIIEANSSFEAQFRFLQSRMKTVKSLVSNQAYPRDVLEAVQKMLPPDVYLETLTITDADISAKATAGTTGGFSQFLANMSNSSLFSGVEIGEVKRNPLIGIAFQLTAKLAGTSKKK